MSEKVSIILVKELHTQIKFEFPSFEVIKYKNKNCNNLNYIKYKKKLKKIDERY